MSTQQMTAFIGNIPVDELSRPFGNSIMRTTYVDALLEMIAEIAEEIEPAPKRGMPERIRVLAEIAKIVNETAATELLSGEQFLRDNQTMRQAA